MKKIGFLILNRNQFLAFESIMKPLNQEYKLFAFLAETSLKSGVLNNEMDRIKKLATIVEIKDSVGKKIIDIIWAGCNKIDYRLKYLLDMRPRFFDPLYWAIKRGIRHIERIDALVTIPKETKFYRYVHSVLNGTPHIAIQPLFRSTWSADRDAMTDKSAYYPSSAVYSNYPADIICVWGDIWKEHLLRKGVTKKIVLTGCQGPPLEGSKFYLNPSVEEKSDYIRLLYATQPAPWIPESIKKQIIKDLITLLLEMNNLMLVVKTHPVDSGKVEIEEIQNYGVDLKDRIKVEHGKFDILLDECNIVLTVYSSSGNWGLLRGKQLIQLNYNNIAAGKSDYISQGVALEATNYELLRKSVEFILKDGKEKQGLLARQKIFCDRLIKYGPDKAIPNIINVIKKEIEN